MEQENPRSLLPSIASEVIWAIWNTRNNNDLSQNNNFSTASKVEDDDFKNETQEEEEEAAAFCGKRYSKDARSKTITNEFYARISGRGYHHHSASSTLLEKTLRQPIWWGKSSPDSDSSKLKAGYFDSSTAGDQTTTLTTTQHQHQQYIREQLDDFCNKNKLKNAVQELEMGFQLSLPRYLQLMQACGDFGEVEYAKKVHHHLIASSTKTTAPIQVEVSTFNQILNMYSHCGSMYDAWEVFKNMPQCNLLSWDTMIAGLAKNGLGEDALGLFNQFKEVGLKPNGQMFMGVFLACSLMCDIDEGMLHFESMSKVYGIVPSMEHYVSVVNMLGSIGYLDEAMEFIEKMPINPSIDIWEALTNLCRAHGNNKLGDHCAEIVNYLDPCRLTDESVKAFAKDRKNNLKTGKMADDPQEDELFDFLRRMISQIKEFGYAPHTPYVWTLDVLLPIEEEEKEECLFLHSEKVNVAFSLLDTPPRTTLRIMEKPGRVCEDCHEALKFISKLAGREITLKNHIGPTMTWIHHFEDGVCTCMDFW